jgi:phage gp29-like protein
MAVEAGPEMERIVGQIEAMVAAAGSLAELREMLLAGFPDIDAAGLAAVMAKAFLAAGFAGALGVEGEDGP